jgi:hypothetical protein
MILHLRFPKFQNLLAKRAIKLANWRKRFAWSPRKLDDDRIIWLEHYYERYLWRWPTLDRINLPLYLLDKGIYLRQTVHERFETAILQAEQTQPKEVIFYK